ncbi:MAG: tellurite resistance TerB family protein [Desulfobulbaceae bacterium]|nr:tellurite resistance TerB family protein [Desulfobulbaceae bacterium]
MIAAAHADGTLDEAEEKAILDRLCGVELDGEEKMFLLDELHQPKSVEELTTGIENSSTAKAMYMLAVAAIEVDTEAERAWLDGLGEQLGLSSEVRRFIEEQG